MKIRTVTFFLTLNVSDFEGTATNLSDKFDDAAKSISYIENKLQEEGYELQTKRMTFNSWTEWLPPLQQTAENNKNKYNKEEVFNSIKPYLTTVSNQLSRIDIGFCSLGSCNNINHISLIPDILNHSPRFNCNVRLSSNSHDNGDGNSVSVIAADNVTCIAAANACLEVHRLCGDNGNFRYCVGFDTYSDCPYFPASFWDSGKNLSANRSDNNNNTYTRGISVGLENADLLFLAAAGTSSVEEASYNLSDIMRQVLAPIQTIVKKCCEDLNHKYETIHDLQINGEDGNLGSGTDYIYTNPYVTAATLTTSTGSSTNARNSGNNNRTNTEDRESMRIQYLGIDASINPGLALPDSVGAGLEHMLYYDIGKDTNTKLRSSSDTQELQTMKTTIMDIDTRFGQFGTLAAVSAITAAIKSLAFPAKIASDGTNSGSGEIIKLCGYSGLMLPVMEDCVLAARASGYTGSLSFYSPENVKATSSTSGSNRGNNRGNMTTTAYSLRDLLTFSTVCGVGLDTVPIAGNSDPAHIAAVYTETSALAFRLKKPLSVRLLPMTGKSAGDRTSVGNNPYLTDTTVFSLL